MYSFNRILVALDNSEHDKELVESASFISSLSRTDDVYFINVVKDLNIPKSISLEFPDLLDKAVEERSGNLEGTVKKYFNYDGAKTHIEIRSGNPTRSILKYSINQKIDLILLGRKNKRKEGGTLINRLARKAACSLLIIPQEYKKQVKSILVPIDFSEYSKDALLQAIDLAIPSLPNVKIYTQNVFQVPNGYRYTGKSFKEFATIMRDNAEKDYNALMYEIDTKGVDIEPVYTLDKSDNIIEKIYNTGLRLKVDAIVIGAKGRTDTTAIFIGSSAEKLIHIDSTIPMMVVRPKGKRAGIIEMLKDI
ncbi:MAG: universal stress protein [Cyclobacteriaceae bacterium]